MVKRFIIALIILSFILPAVIAQDDSASPFTPQGDEPIVERPRQSRENRGADLWDGQYTDPGAVVYHDGQFHMFRNGFVGWPSRVRIGYLVSDDGITWEEPQDEPILDSQDVPFADIAALASAAYVEEDGTWVLYFYTWNTSGGAIGDSTIGRATAPSPLGEWTVDSEPVFVMDEAGEWDDNAVSTPAIVRTDDGFFMYYDSRDPSGLSSIGLATSDDGITWTRYEDNPVLIADADWENGMVHQPRVVHTGDMWIMLYRSVGEGGAGNMRFGIATSDDGYTWTKVASNPVTSPAIMDVARSFWFASLAYHDETLYLYQEVMPSTNTTDIYVLTAPLGALMGDASD